MKNLPAFLLLLSLGLLACTGLRAQPVNNVTFGSTVGVWSGHTTVRERVDASVNERIELWNRTWTVSPSGQVYANTDHWGFNAADGYSATTITFNETGRWTYWASDGGSIDSWVYGDGPYDWYLWPHNPPNGVGYGGWGRRITAFIDVQPAPPTNVAPTIAWTSSPASAASGQNYTITAHGHDADGNLTQVNVWKSGAAFAFAGGGNGTDGDSGNTTSDTGPTSVTFTAQAVDGAGATSATISHTVTISAANRAPTITWTSAPSSAASGQNYTITAHGNDADGNLTQVNVWKNGAAFAFAGGGNGTDGDSGNTTSDAGPATVTFTAQSVDSNGATSATISHSVSIAAANTAPTIVWNTTPGAVASGQSYTVSAHGHDADGNLTQVNVWRNGTAYAFAGGGNGTDNDSGNSSTDTGPTTVTYTADAVDSTGARSGTILQTVTISAPPSVTASISASPTNATAPGSTTVTWSSTNASSVSVTGGGINSSATSGSQAVSGLAAGTYTFTITAQGAGGPITQTATLTVTAPANSAPTIAWNTTPGTVASGQSYTISAHGHDADGNLTEVNVWRNGVAYAFAGGGNGTDNDSGNPSTDTGPLTVTYTAESVDANGVHSGTISQTVTVSAPAAVAASIGASPDNTSVPGATTITWSSANATAVSVSGNGVSSSAASGSQAVNGLPAGTHVYTITAQGSGGPVTQTATVTVNAAASVTASISASPTSVTAPGASTISWSSANATSVSVSGNGISSAAANGSQMVSGLSVGTYTYTITAQGPNGPATQSATVTVTSAPNSAPTIAWNTTPGTVASGQSYTLSAHGSDADGNLTNVNVWRDGVPYAFAGGGNGSDNDSGNPSTDTGPRSIVYTAQAVDAAGATSATISQTVTITAPPSVTGSISASPTSATVPGATTLSWSTSNATAVSVTGTGLSSTAASGSQSVSGLAVGTHTYTLTAQGPGGPLTQTAVVTITAIPNNAPTIAWNTSPGTVASGQSYTISAHGGDADGNLTNVNVWRDGVPYAFAGGGNGSDNDSGNPSTDIGPRSIVYTAQAVDAEGATSATISQTVTVAAPPPVTGSIAASPTVIYSNQTAALDWTTSGAAFRWVHGSQPGLNGVNIYPAAASGSAAVSGLPPGNYRFTIEYGPGSAATGMAFADLTVLAVNRTVFASVQPAGSGSVAGSGTYAEGSTATITAVPDATHMFVGWSGDLSSTANPLTFTVGAQDYTLVANFALRTFAVTASVSPAGAGSVTGAGTYTVGAMAILSATPDATHVFTGWSGDITGSANPVSFTVNSTTNVIANFAAASFVLTTAAGSGGSVTPGGTYSAGVVVTVTATPDGTHRFTNWTGDASGTATTTAVTMDRAKSVQANFAAKTAQTIAFDPPGDHGLTSPPFTLTATATSGLPVSFSLLTGPAILTGSSVQMTGAGPVTLQANQAGDEFFLPATPVNQTFNVIAAATLKYRGQSRTLLRDETTRVAPPFVLEKP